MSFTARPIDSPHGEVLDKWFGHPNSFYEFNPGKFVMPMRFSDCLRKILLMEVREDDVWLVSYPRAGSTWCQEMVWLMENDLDFEKATNIMQQLRAPLLEISSYFEEHREFVEMIGNSVEYVERMPSPRFIKTHLPLDLLPLQFNRIKPKMIYVARNPKDLCVSYYHHLQMFHGIKADFDDVAEFFLWGKLPLGCVLDHCLPFWEKRNDTNILFLKYEDVKKNTKDAIETIAGFLRRSLTNEQVEKLENFLHVDKMRHNPGMNMSSFVARCREFGHTNGGEYFIRKGVTGDWKNYMSESLSEKFDTWMEERTKGTNLMFT